MISAAPKMCHSLRVQGSRRVTTTEAGTPSFLSRGGGGRGTTAGFVSWLNLARESGPNIRGGNLSNQGQRVRS
jgi:hypothetical protein